MMKLWKKFRDHSKDLRGKMMSGQLGHPDLEQYIPRMRKELSAKSPDGDALAEAFELMVQVAEGFSHLAPLVTEALQELLERQFVGDRPALLFRWACAPPAWMSEELADFVYRAAWLESLDNPDSAVPLTLALILRQRRPALYQALKASERLNELLRRGRLALPGSRRPLIAQGLQAPLARAVLPPAQSEQRPDCVWSLALLLEAAASNDRDTPESLRQLAAWIDIEEERAALAWILETDWRSAFPDAPAELETQLLVGAALKILRAGAEPPAGRLALARLSESRPETVAEFLAALRRQGVDDLLRTAVVRSAAALGVPLPGAAVGQQMPEGSAQRFIVAHFLFSESELKSRQAAQYSEVLGALASSRQEVWSARDAVVARLASLAQQPIDWDLLAWPAAQALAAEDAAGQVYSLFLDRSPPGAREPILQSALAGETELSLEKLPLLVAGWQPEPGAEELQVEVYWHLASHAIPATAHYLTDEAKRTAIFYLVTAALALREHRLLEAERLLAATRAEGPELPRQEGALSWQDQWQELIRQTEGWTAGQIETTDDEAELWWLSSRLRWQEAESGPALLALAEHLALVDSAEPVLGLLDDVLAAEDLELAALLQAAQRLLASGRHPAVSFRLADLALRTYGVEAAETVDDLLQDLASRPLGEELAPRVALARVRLPVVRGDVPEKLRRLRHALERRELSLASVAEETWSLPLEALAAPEDFLWSLGVFLQKGWLERALERFDRLGSAGPRAEALDLLGAAGDDLKSDFGLAVGERWLEHYGADNDSAGLRRGVVWLVDAFEALPGDKAMALILKGLRKLADLGSLEAVSYGLAFLYRHERFEEAGALLHALLAQQTALPAEDLELCLTAYRGLAEQEERRELILALARFYEGSSPEAALRLLTAYFEHEEASETLAPVFRDELIGFANRPAGGALSASHILVARSHLASGQPREALESLWKASDRGGDEALQPHLQTLLEVQDDELHAEALELKARSMNRLGEVAPENCLALIRFVEEILPPKCMQDWQARLLELEEFLDDPQSRTENPDERLGWTVFAAWIADLRHPTTEAWEPFSGRFRFGALIEMLQRHPRPQWIDWLQERLVSRVGELDSSLLASLIHILLNAQDRSHGANLQIYIGDLWRRYTEDPLGNDLETVRQILVSFIAGVDLFGTTDEEPYWWLLSAQLEARDAAAAVQQARLILAPGNGGRQARILSRIEQRGVAGIAGATWEPIWILVIDLCGGLEILDEPDRMVLALACARRLAGLGRCGEDVADLASRLLENAGGLSSATGELTLAVAMLEFQAGHIERARELWVELSRTMEFLTLEKVEDDPMRAYDVQRPTAPEAWGAVLLQLLGALKRGAESSGRLDSPDAVQELLYTIAILWDPPELHAAIAAIRQLRDSEEAFQDHYSEGLTVLLEELASRREQPWPSGEELELLILKTEYLLEQEQSFEEAHELLRPLVPSWSDAADKDDFHEPVLTALRQPLRGIGASLAAPALIALRIDIELSLAKLAGDWTQAEALLHVLLARGIPGLGSNLTELCELIPGLKERLINLGRENPGSLALFRRLGRDDGRVLAEVLAALRLDREEAVPASWPREAVLMASDHPESAAFRAWACEVVDDEEQLALQCAARIDLEQAHEDPLAPLAALARGNDRAALLLGRQLADREQTSSAEIERLMERWDETLNEQSRRSDLLWGLLPLYSRIREARGELRAAHRLKLRESHLKVHDEICWKDTVRLWQAAQEQSLAAVAEPENLEEALQGGRLLRLLLRPEDAIARLQPFRQRASGEDKGQLLCELGLSFGLCNRYDLAACCHAEADELLEDPQQQVENLFAWGVALSYLQERDRAREIFLQILAQDIQHEGARAELEKLDLPPTVLQLYQLVELTHASWDGVLRLLKRGQFHQESSVEMESGGHLDS